MIKERKSFSVDCLVQLTRQSFIWGCLPSDTAYSMSPNQREDKNNTVPSSLAKAIRRGTESVCN